jgi:hypothetical protein
VKVGESHRLSIQLVQIWRFEHWITVTTQIAIPLIVGHHKNDVRRAELGSQCSARKSSVGKENNQTYQSIHGVWASHPLKRLSEKFGAFGKTVAREDSVNLLHALPFGYLIP